MKKLLSILFLFWQTSLMLPAQSDYYWIQLKDKNLSPFETTAPLQFLSQKSIDRRTKQAIGITENDLPVSPAYTDSIRPFVSELVHRLKWLNMLVVKVEQPDFLDSIRQFSFVDSIAPIYFTPARSEERKDKLESVEPVDQFTDYTSIYGIAYNQARMLNADLLHQMGYRGQGITIGMMDNGYDRVDLIAGFDSVRPRIYHTWNFVHNDANVYKDGGHGTNTFSCIGGNLPNRFLGTAPDAGFYLYTSEDDTREWVMEEFHWAAAAEMADSAGADILSTSLGYTYFNGDTGSHTYADMDGDRTVITRASNLAFSKGMLVCNSAGNYGAGTWRYISAPADGFDVLAVGAVDENEKITSFSSRGPNATGRIKPDLCAQGSFTGIFDIWGNLARGYGTSFSCPILAGAAASLWSAFPDKSAREIRDAIISSADRYQSPDNDYGYGIPNFYTAYQNLLTVYNENLLHEQEGSVTYPVPFTDELNISLYNDTAGLRQVEIFDLQGRKVYAFEVYLRKDTYEIIRLNGIQALAAGTYILRTDGRKKYAQRILKVK